MSGAPDALVGPDFFAREALEVARDLLGRWLVRDEVTLRITEVEAYRGPTDTACHTRAGRTPRNAAMWGPPGRAYVYRCYGLHWMLNLVTGPEAGSGAAVLIRACEAVTGLPVVRARRGGREGPTLLAGPGRVAAALALDGAFDHHPVTEPGGLELRWGAPADRIVAGPRVGVDYARPEDRDAPWRLAVAGSRWVSHRATLREG